MFIRTIRPDDAEQFLRLRMQLDEETQFMMLEPGERNISLEEQLYQIEQVLSKENQVIFVAEQDDQLIGYLGAIGGDFKRNKHSAEIVIGILQAYTGQGLGSQLFIAMEAWARQKQLHRLELTVMTHNRAGVALYRKRGFEIEGTKRHALVVNGKYVDEFYMAKLLG